MSETEYTIHSSLFDVVRTISLEISSDVNADSDYSAPIEGIGFEVPAVSVPDFGSLVMGLPPVVSIANPSLNAATAEYLVFHKSVFGIYQDREVTIESSCIVNSDFVYPVIQIHEFPESVVNPSSEIVSENYQAFHKSQFDIWKPFYANFSVQPAVPSVSDVSPVCCISAESVASAIINYPYLPIGQTITGNSDIVASSDVNVGRCDFDVDCSLVASSVGITAEYVAANIKEIKFGSFVLPHSKRKSEDSIKPLYNDRFNRLSNVNGVFNRPRAYERTITIHGETNKRSEYDQLHALIGPKMALYVHGFYFPDCELSGLDIKQTKPGLDRYPYTATFTQRVYDSQDTASFVGLEFSHVVSVGDIKKSRISDERYAKAGIAEPRAYQASVELELITEYPDEYSNAEARMGSIGNLIINGNTYQNAIITDISGIQQVGGGNAWSYTVSFNWFVFSISDSVSLGVITLPNILEISDEKRTPILDDRFAKAGVSEPNAYKSDWTISGVFTTDAQFNNVDALIGTNLSVTINGKTYADTRITDVSISQFRGGGSVRAYSIGLSRYQFNSPDVVTFDNIGMQNVISKGDETRTPIQDERYIRAGISEPRAYSASCSFEVITTNASEYGLIESKMGKSAPIIINGITYQNARITDLSKVQPRGGGDVWVYSVSFTWYVFETVDSATFAGIVLDNPEIRDEKRTPLSDERLIKAGISEPKSYSYDVSIDCITTNPALYTNLEPKLNQVGSLVINGRTYSNARITDVSGLQPRGGGDIWKYTVSFMCYVFSSTDVVSFGDITFQNIIEVSEDNRTPILTESYNQRGISEPAAYSVKNTISVVDLTGNLYDTLSDSKTGNAATLTINGKTYQKSKIGNLAKWTPRGGGNTQIITVEFSSYWFSTTDTAQFGAIALSNPVLPNAMDITPEYSVEMSTAYNISDPIPIIVRRFAFECITENPAEFEAIVSSIGPKLTLTINGKSYELCYISMLSALQPRGGGNIWSYTIEFSQKKGERLVNASFDGITLPNAVMSDVEREILQTRKTMHNGTISASLGSHAAKRVSFTCQANSTTAFDAIENLIGEKKTLIVEGKTYTKAYISELSDNVKIGDGSAKLYTYNVTFEQETA